MRAPVAFYASVTLAVLAACGGGSSQLPIASDSQSWVDPAAKSGAPTNISDRYEKKVYIYSYPALKRVGALTGFGQPVLNSFAKFVTRR